MNRERVRLALCSVRDLNEVVGNLTEEEILHVLEVESQSTRRRAVLLKLIARLTRMHEARKRQELTERYMPSDT